MNSQFRHGDLLIEEVTSLPGSGLSKQNHDVILEGEVSGHAHRLVGGDILVEARSGNLYLTTREHSAVVHEEHRTLPLPIGVFRVVRQREFTPAEPRYVFD